jgi:hypothetical protein
MSAALLLTEEAKAFVSACEVKHDAFLEWLEAMNGPLPAEKVELVHVPRIACAARRPAPKHIPCWSLQ